MVLLSRRFALNYRCTITIRWYLNSNANIIQLLLLLLLAKPYYKRINVHPRINNDCSRTNKLDVKRTTISRGHISKDVVSMVKSRVRYIGNGEILRRWKFRISLIIYTIHNGLANKNILGCAYMSSIHCSSGLKFPRCLLSPEYFDIFSSIFYTRCLISFVCVRQSKENTKSNMFHVKPCPIHARSNLRDVGHDDDRVYEKQSMKRLPLFYQSVFGIEIIAAIITCCRVVIRREQSN